MNEIMRAHTDALFEIETLLTGKVASKNRVLRYFRTKFKTPILLLKIGFREISYTLGFGSIVLLIALYVASSFFYGFLSDLPPEANLPPEFLAIGAAVFSGILTFFAAPSRFGTNGISDTLLSQAVQILKNHELHLGPNTRSIAIEAIEEKTKSRSRKWFAVVALVWGMCWYYLRSLEQASFRPEDLQTVVWLVFFILFVWVVVLAFEQASQKFLYLLKFADAAILDEEQNLSGSQN